jgi:hypothetical protein
VKTLRRNNRANVDRGELRLIRVGHALWYQMKRERAKNGGYLPQSDPIWGALATFWRLAFSGAMSLIEAASLPQLWPPTLGQDQSRRETPLTPHYGLKRASLPRCTL